jgi:FKBP-type peptidyl-prolyl cis-trans isomerase
MRKLETREWIAVVISVFVLGFFFAFGSDMIAFLNGGSTQAQNQTLQVNDVKVGEGEMAVSGKKLTVHYTGVLGSDGKVFDSSLSRNEPLQFTLGVGEVIRGWDEGLQGMKVGGRRILIIPPEYGYGPYEYGPVPADSVLIFEVELLKVE